MHTLHCGAEDDTSMVWIALSRGGSPSPCRRRAVMAQLHKGTPVTAERPWPPWGRQAGVPTDTSPRQGSSRAAPSQHHHPAPTSLPALPPLSALLPLPSLSLSLSHHSWLKLRWNFVFLSSEFGPGKSLPAIPVASQRTSRLEVMHMI